MLAEILGRNLIFFLDIQKKKILEGGGDIKKIFWEVIQKIFQRIAEVTLAVVLETYGKIFLEKIHEETQEYINFAALGDTPCNLPGGVY